MKSKLRRPTLQMGRLIPRYSESLFPVGRGAGPRGLLSQLWLRAVTSNVTVWTCHEMHTQSFIFSNDLQGRNDTPVLNEEAKARKG